MPKRHRTPLTGFVEKETATKSGLAAIAAGTHGSQAELGYNMDAGIEVGIEVTK
jgi:hypothetical protein